MVATAAQIAANRANARLSTGPRTPEGKAASSRNAVTHGAYASDDTILATAPATYLDDFRAHFQPVGVLEKHLVDHLAVLASRRERLQLAMDALLELNERHALIEHLHERYGISIQNGKAMGQPSWQAAMRRYDGHDGPDPRRPELVSDPALDSDPILVSLAYTLSGPRAAALFRHEASVDRRFSATLKELTTLQTLRQKGANAPLSARPLQEPRLPHTLDRAVSQAADTLNARIEPITPPAPPLPTSSAPTPATPTPNPVRSSDGQTCPPDPTVTLTPFAASLVDLPGLPTEQSHSPVLQYATPLAFAQFEANVPDHAGTAAAPADLICEDEPNVFRGVLPRDSSRSSSIPALWPGAAAPTFRK